MNVCAASSSISRIRCFCGGLKPQERRGIAVFQPTENMPLHCCMTCSVIELNCMMKRTYLAFYLTPLVLFCTLDIGDGRHQAAGASV